MDRHVEAFNDAVTSGTFDRFVATFTPDAVMRFTNVPAGPFDGRQAILDGYREQPPDDTMRVLDVDDIDEDGARVRFAWSAGGTGSMLLRWSDEQVRELTITFDR